MTPVTGGGGSIDYGFRPGELGNRGRHDSDSVEEDTSNIIQRR